ncbi:MAG TPA: helix-turn-helix domain-containing protein [Longimicrobiaceae bacterium]|nr:helix-turn-helix domain-containing protein [Longimicrobiaceae bacterium]
MEGSVRPTPFLLPPPRIFPPPAPAPLGAPAEEHDFPVLHLRPPYRTLPAPVPVHRLHSGQLGLGSILALPVWALAADWRLLAHAVHRLRVRFPGAPVILWAAGAPERGIAELALRAGRLRVRALLLDGHSIAEVLRPVLTSREGLAEDAVDWLHLRGLAVSPALAHIVRHVFALAPQHSRIHPLLDCLGEAESSVRARFRKKGLPPPHCWLQAARALYAAVEIQGRPGEPLLRIADTGGYGDAAALSKQVYGAFGIRPSALRGTLGWEWLLDQWAAREGLVAASG